MGKQDLINSASSYKTQITQYKSQNQTLQEKVDALDLIYDDMKNVKRSFEVNKYNVESFGRENYALWVGELFNKYQYLILDDLVNYSFVNLINQIDGNMVIVNNKKTEYQNEIYKNEGLIGHFKACLNSLWTQIENWID